jgi:integrase/recombinase XerD
MGTLAQPVKQSGQKTPLSVVLADFSAFHTHLSRSTLHVYGLTLNRFFTACQTPDLDDIGRLHIIRWLNTFYGEKTAGTYNQNLLAVKTFFRFAADFYGLPDPAAPIPPRKIDRLPDPRVISLDEYHRIQAQTGWGRDIAVFLANTGLRAAEFCGLNPKHINADQRLLTVLGKGAKIRSIPLNPAAWQIQCTYQFCLNFKKSNALNRNGLRYQLDRLAETAGLDPFGPHSLRHFFATSLLNLGVPVAAVSVLLGHSDIKTTINSYYHLSQSLESKSVDLLGTL